jgi:hypothetical protein
MLRRTLGFAMALALIGASVGVAAAAGQPKVAVARVDLARQLVEAIWHVLTKNVPFHPAGPAMGLVA